MNAFTFILTSCLVALGAGASAAPPKRLALLVGIDDYGARATPRVSPDQQWKPLAGSVNDVRALEAELVRRGFSVATLTNAEATREGILAAFRTHLVERAGAGDVVMFHFSGHGQQIPDDDGDEVDGYDEALVPYDNRGTADGTGNLRDDDLGALLDTLGERVAQVVVTLDACHSGTGTRGVYGVRGGPPSGPPSTGGGARGRADDGAVGGRRAIVLTATRPDELAAETRDPERDVIVGAFSHALVSALRGAGPDTTWRQVMDRVGVGVMRTTQTQHPQIEGDRDRVVFAGRLALPPSYYIARPALPDGRVPIEAGALHGLAVGSELGLYPLGATAMDDDAPPIRVRVESVEPALAHARPVAPPSAPAAALLTDGAQAVELVSPRTPRRLRVATSDGKLGASIAGLPFAIKVGADAEHDVRVDVGRDGVRLFASDGSAVRFPRGPEQPMDEALVKGDPALSERLVTALELHWRRLRVASLVNDDARQALPVSLALHKVDAHVGDDGAARVTRDHGPLDKSGGARLRDGDVVQLRVKNLSDRTAYVAILELATDGSIVVWYPDATLSAVDTALAPGQERVIAPPFVVTPPAGDALYKLVATSTPVDLGGLTKRVQSGGKRASDHPLALMLEEVASPTRARPFSVSKKERWGSDEARITIE
ncbi:MAG: caspase family protein [Deltaproteobacteria bacterium]|nr:caspase family protein [Deltaproteobacteria bacterium]